jgi:hypothetical protein
LQDGLLTQKGFEMIDTLLTQLIDFVKATSPILWETLVRQVYVETLGCALTGIFAMALASLCFVAGKRCNVSDGDRSVQVVIWIVAIGFLGVGGMFLFSALAHILNPNYYAIRIIIEQLTGR